MSLKKQLNHRPLDLLSAKGLFKQDWDALNPCQRECSSRLAKTIQIEQEVYMTKHPEVLAMHKVLVASLATLPKRRTLLPEIAMHFTRPVEAMFEDINAFLKVDGPPYIPPENMIFSFKDSNLVDDLKSILQKYYPYRGLDVKEEKTETPDTASSDFVSIQTSESTLPTPEPELSPEPTMAHIISTMVSNIVDKAIYNDVNEKTLRYDTAYVELMKAVEQAMEVPVALIKEDLTNMICEAYTAFEDIIQEKEQKARETALANRMKKKLKRHIRQLKNFKGNESPPTPKSDESSHESYRGPPPTPCQCAPTYHFNRYRKNRFGVYIPSSEVCEYEGENVIETPVESKQDILESE